MASADRSSERRREVDELQARIRLAIEKEVAALARLLTEKGDRDLFGQTEFEVRDVVLRIGAKAYEERLRGKKTMPAKLTGR
jgi:hypothetical protein